MNSNRIVQLGALAVTLTCLFVNGNWGIPTIEEKRKELQLGFARSGDESVPPSVAFASTMLGPLRGFMINGLWYEVEQLKQEGKFAQINEMSRWITNLQPRYPEVWRFHAWNMAYNVSVQCYTQEERWDWVNKGIRLLREEGIRWNPRAVRLYRELSWIFYHKVGQYSDDVQWYYKTRLAREWQELLGAYSTGYTKDQAIQWMKRIVDAPDELSAVIAANPKVRDVLDQLRKGQPGFDIEAGFDEGKKKERERLLRSVGRVLMYNYAQRLEELPLNIRAQPQFYETVIVDVLKQKELREPVAALVAHLRRRVLIDSYNMQPKVILELMEEFGPIDLRHAAAHGMYWAHLGAEMLGKRLNKDKVDYINTLRQRIHTMQDFTDTGRVFYDPYADFPGSQRRALVLAPDVRFIEAYNLTVKKSEKFLEEAEPGASKPYQTGHENFLLKATQYHFFYGDMKKSVEYYNMAKEMFGQEPHNKQSGRYLRSYEENVRLQIKETLDGSMEDTGAFVQGMVYQAFDALAQGYPQEFERHLELAKFAYDKHQAGSVPTPIATSDRMSLPPFADMINNAFFNGMIAPSPVEFRIKLWSIAPLRLKQPVYDKIKPRVYKEAEDAGLNPAAAFPEPENMEQYRKDNPQNAPPPTPGTPGTPTTPSPLKPGP